MPARTRQVPSCYFLPKGLVIRRSNRRILALVMDMKKAGEYGFIFMNGFFGYGLLEMLWRGYTHWTMGLAGGICFLAFYILSKSLAHLRIFYLCSLGALLITGIELVIGCWVNLGLGWQIWDYSDCPFNLWGQICLLYSLYWYFLCLFALWFGNLLAGFYRAAFLQDKEADIELLPYS